jgi:hypothetical protein
MKSQFNGGQKNYPEGESQTGSRSFCAAVESRLGEEPKPEESAG